MVRPKIFADDLNNAELQRVIEYNVRADVYAPWSSSILILDNSTIESSQRYLVSSGASKNLREWYSRPGYGAWSDVVVLNGATIDDLISDILNHLNDGIELYRRNNTILIKPGKNCGVALPMKSYYDMSIR